MAIDDPRLRPRTSDRAIATFRIGLGALLAAELVGLSLRFDAESLAESIPWAGRFVRLVHYLPQLLVAACAATAILFGRRRFATPAASDGPEGAEAGLGWVALALHLCLFAAFSVLSGWLLEGSARTSPRFTIWLAVWSVLGLGSMATWAATVLHVEGWIRLVRLSGRPIALGAAIGAAAWGLGRVTGDLWEPLGFATFQLTRGMLGLVFSTVDCRLDDRILGVDGFSVHIAPECSGYEGMGLVTILMIAYLWIFRKDLRIDRAWLLVPISILAIYLANAFRIAALIVLGAKVSRSVAAGGFHSQAGWIAFNAVGLGLIAVSRRFRFFRKTVEAERTEVSSAGNPTAAYLAPIFAIVATAMLTAAASSGFDLYYPLRVLAAIGVLWTFRRSYGDLRSAPSWGAFAVGAVAFAVWTLLEPLSNGGRASMSGVPEAIQSLPTTAAAIWLVFRVVGYVVTVPLAEELAFRGYLARRLVSADFTAVAIGRTTTVAILLSSAIFGLMHDRILAGTLAGVLYAYAARRRGRLLDAVVAHAVTNALIAAHVFVTGDWSLWG